MTLQSLQGTGTRGLGSPTATDIGVAQAGGDLFMTSPDDTVTLLRHSRLQLTKRYELSDGNPKKVADYPNAKTFTLSRVPVHGLRDLAAVILKAHRDGRTAIIRADPLFDTPWYGRVLLHMDSKTGDEASVQACARRWVCVDVDQLSAPDPTSQGAARYVLSRLPEPFRTAKALAQFSASAGMDADSGEREIKLHLWFWLSEPLAANQLKAWLRREIHAKVVDPATFNDRALHYVAPPECIGFDDPLTTKERFFWLNRDAGPVQVPEDLPSARLGPSAVKSPEELLAPFPPDERGQHVRDCLSYLPIDEEGRWREREHWIHALHAIRGAMGDDPEGLQIARAWSEKGAGQSTYREPRADDYVSQRYLELTPRSLGWEYLRDHAEWYRRPKCAPGGSAFTAFGFVEGDAA